MAEKAKERDSVCLGVKERHKLGDVQNHHERRGVKVYRRPNLLYSSKQNTRAMITMLHVSGITSLVSGTASQMVIRWRWRKPTRCRRDSGFDCR